MVRHGRSSGRVDAMRQTSYGQYMQNDALSNSERSDRRRARAVFATNRSEYKSDLTRPAGAEGNLLHFTPIGS